MNLFQATALAALLSAIPVLAHSQDHRHATPQPQATPPSMMQGGMMQGRSMSERMGGQGQAGRHGIDRVEGRLAFIKTELKISDAQLPAWNAFAEAVRTNATTMHAEHQFMHGRVGPDVSLPDRLAAQANAFAAHAEEMAKLKTVLDPLYASLSAEQKKTADEIVFSPMGVPVGRMM
ncbi:MAG: hypothetical protein FJX55_10995 [Alphaproteobacteria bacterium]|nr:hypothetical protein [Alphaproteobacteria bacterium]